MLFPCYVTLVTGALEYELCIYFGSLYGSWLWGWMCESAKPLSLVCWWEKLFPSFKTQAVKGCSRDVFHSHLCSSEWKSGAWKHCPLFWLQFTIMRLVLIVSRCLIGRFKWASATSVYVINECFLQLEHYQEHWNKTFLLVSLPFLCQGEGGHNVLNCRWGLRRVCPWLPHLCVICNFVHWFSSLDSLC